MPSRYARNCDHCGQYYEGYGERFCSRECTGASFSTDPKTSDEPLSLVPGFVDWEPPENVDWREWFDAWENVLELHKRMDPTQEILTIDLSTSTEPIAIAFASDLHMGGGFTNHAAIRKTIEYIIETDGLYLGITGDSIEGFLPGVNPSEAVENQTASVKGQLGALNSLVQELSDRKKFLWMTYGEHDGKWWEKAVGVNMIKWECHDRVPYFTGRGIIRLLLGDQEYFICVNHRERFQSQWNKVHPARRQYERMFPADVNATAHLHSPAYACEHHYDDLRRMGLNLGGKHWMIQSGTFKTGPDPYTIRGWTRGILGVPTVVFQPDHHDTDCLDSPFKAMGLVRGMAA